LYICGSPELHGTELATLHCFMPFTRTWESLAPFPLHRTVSLAELDGVIYAGSAQCFDGEGSLVKSDPRKGYWQTMPPFLIPRVGYGMASAAGRLFVLGGRCEGFEEDEEFPAPHAGEYFDARTQLWCFLAVSEVQRRNPLVTRDSSSLYVCATIFDEETFDPSHDVVECFDAHSMRWEPIPQPTSQSTIRLMAMLLSSCGSVYMGSDESIHRYDVTARRWDVLPPMPDELRHFDSAEVACRGRLFVCGGCDGTDAMSSFGCFDPVAFRWEVLTPMLRACASPAMVVFASQVYVCGGAGKECARYCLLRNSWEVLPDLVEPVFLPEGIVSVGIRCISE